MKAQGLGREVGGLGERGGTEFQGEKGLGARRNDQQHLMLSGRMGSDESRGCATQESPWYLQKTISIDWDGRSESGT